MLRQLKKWMFDPSPAGLLLFITIMCIIAAIVILFCLPAEADTPAEEHGQQGSSSQASEVEAMILSIVGKYPWNPANRGNKYRKEIAAAAAMETNKHGIPDGLVPAIMFRESSFDHRKVDKVGAAGLMQVSPYMVNFLGCEMDTVAGQVDCGCRALVYYRGVCGGDWRGALSAYGSRTAVCNPKRGGKLHWMVNDRFTLAAELREVVGK